MKVTISSAPAFGKTELAHILSEEFDKINGHMVEYLERANDWVTPLFYEDKNRYALTMQIQKMVERLQMFIESNEDENSVIDQNLFYDMVYSKANWLTGTMSDDEYKLYTDTAYLYRDKMYEYAPDLDIILVGSVQHQFDNMAKRGRDFEAFEEGSEDQKYFEVLNQLNYDYASTDNGFPHIVIDVTGRDFVHNPEDKRWILGQIYYRMIQLGLLTVEESKALTAES